MQRKRTISVISCQLRRAARTFTLVEMLVVIAIIGILASLLMPSLARSLDSARQLNCVNNLKQINAATHMYAAQNANWVWVVGYTASFDPWYYALSGGNFHKQEKLLERGSVFWCPANSRISTFIPFRTYGIYTSWRDALYSARGFTFARYVNSTNLFYNLGRVKRPSDVILYADTVTREDSSAYVSQRGRPHWAFSPTQFIEDSGVHLIHNGYANSAFMDGHVKGHEVMGLYDTPQQIKRLVDTNGSAISLP